MAKAFCHWTLLVLGMILVLGRHSEQLPSSQAQTLIRIQGILNFPAILISWKNDTDFCDTEPSSSVTVVCYEESITQLHIIGQNGVPPLPRNFSMHSFITTLVKLPDLKVLSLVSLGLWGPMPRKIARLSSLEILNISSNYFYGSLPEEISYLRNLQTLIVDDNMFSGELSDWMSMLPVLAVLSLKKNSFNGSLPNSLGSLENLRILTLSHNRFYGEVPDLSSLNNLQVLDLEDNALGPQFPRLGTKLITLVLKKNRFSSGIPVEVSSSSYQLKRLDISYNRFVGPFPPSLLALPSITYLNIAGNKFTGMLFGYQSCSDELEFVDLSSNLLTGNLPTCLKSDSKKRVVLYGRNCLATGEQNQHPFSFCRNEALAVGIIPHRKKQKRAAKAALVLGTIGGILGGISIFCLVFLVVRRLNSKKATKTPPTRLIAENASTVYSSKLLSDARYISKTMKLGALGLPAYRTFSLEELEEATNNFDTSTFMGEGSHGQMYRGKLKDGSLVAIRCLKMKKSHSTQNFMHHIELILKLRHRHLVSSLGHCFECYLDDASVSRIFLIFEFVPNGTLRSWISATIITEGQFGDFLALVFLGLTLYLTEGHSRQTLTWTQRIAAAIGVAKGIEFLHTGFVPGVYSNNLRITDILLDRDLIAKISSYNLPLLAENMGKVSDGISSSGSKELSTSTRVQNEDKIDIYAFGVILLELIMGRPFDSMNEVDVVRNWLQSSLTADEESRRNMADTRVQRTCSDESLKTMMEICIRCLHKNPAERASIEDVLWNLQFAAQVEDALRGDSESSDGSPVFHSLPPRLRLNIN